MNFQVASDRPTVYADMNVFRYLAFSELEITKADEFLWIYSHVHLDEVVRGASRDALDGMHKLRAVELWEKLGQIYFVVTPAPIGSHPAGAITPPLPARPGTRKSRVRPAAPRQ